MRIEQNTGLAGVYFNKWISIINDVIECTDEQNNTFRWLPRSGGYYDQDTEIMNIWIMVKQEYMKLITDEAFRERMRKANG